MMKKNINQPSKLLLPADYRVNNPNIIKVIQADLNQWHGGKPHYLFMGTVGCGKTHLAEIIFKSIVTDLNNILEIYRAKERKFDFSNPESIENARIYNTKLDLAEIGITGALDAIKTVTASQLYWDYMNNDFRLPDPTIIFCLDDVGSEKDTPVSREVIASTLTTLYERFKAGKNRFVILTTNLSAESLKYRYGVRVNDRLHEMCTILKFNKHSFRQEMLVTVEG